MMLSVTVCLFTSIQVNRRMTKNRSAIRTCVPSSVFGLVLIIVGTQFGHCCFQLLFNLPI